MPLAAFPPAAFSIIHFMFLLSVLLYQSVSPSLYQFAFPDIHRIALEHLFQPFMYRLFAYPSFQHHLEESASAGAADQPSGDHWLNGREDLVDQGIGTSRVHLLA